MLENNVVAHFVIDLTTYARFKTVFIFIDDNIVFKDFVISLKLE